MEKKQYDKAEKKHLLIGFTGSVASILYEKICKAFMEDYEVVVVMTESSRQFVDMNKLRDIGIAFYDDSNEFYQPFVTYFSSAMKERCNQKVYKKDDQILHIKLREWADC